MINKLRQHSDTHKEVIVVCSAVGGVGRTTVTVNLASLSAKQNKKVSILDGDLQFGDAALALDLKPEMTMQEAIENKDILNSKAYCLHHQTGIELLSAPSRPEFADLVTPDNLTDILDVMADRTDLLLVDTQPGLTDHNIPLLERADRILVITTPGMAVLKNTKLMVETFTALGWKQKLSLIVNKSTSTSAVDVHEIPEIVKVEEKYFLPHDDKHVSLSLDKGYPIVLDNPKLSFSKELTAAAEQIFPQEWKSQGARKDMPRSFINRLTGWRRKNDEFISKTAIKKS